MNNQKCILVCVDNSSYDVKTSMEELSELAFTAGANVKEKFIQKLDTINSSTYVGSGKLLEIKEYCEKNRIMRCMPCSTAVRRAAALSSTMMA